MSNPPFTIPVYTRLPPDQLRPPPPAKRLPELKPKQGVKPTFPPPMPSSRNFGSHLLGRPLPPGPAHSQFRAYLLIFNQP